ncbi:MAG: DUF4395 domain-containing protein [Spirochaetales bacterium]|nr:DUF4395 domain-containing protein [Spirochaetales bacterium]
MENKQIPERVQENRVRTVALEVIIISSASLISGQAVLMILLGADFLIRALGFSRYSPLAMISRSSLPDLLPFRKRLILARPKKFAASIGAILAITAGASGLLGHFIPMYYITATLLLFSVLETFFKFCAGCLIFGFLIQLKFIKEENCTDCSFNTE